MRLRVPVTPLALLGAMLATSSRHGEPDLDPETAEALDRLESEIGEVADEIDRSELRPGLEQAWEAIEAELAQTMDSIRSGVAVNTHEIQLHLDEFQQRLESVEAEEGLEDAWMEMRADLGEVVAEIG